MTYTLGIDLGGTKIAAGILDTSAGTLVARAVVPTHAHEGSQAVMARAAQLARDLCAKSGIKPAAVGFGVPAVIDVERGVTLLMPNLPGDWHERPVVAELQTALDLPVALVNDARAFTLAEATLGAGRGAETVVCFTVGTGIGGGIVFHGRLHMGFDGAAGELGHQTIEPDGPLCGCGNRGCLEALASGYAISEMGAQAAHDDPESPIYMLAGGDMSAVTPEVIMRAAEMGDEVARRIIDRAGRYLGIGVSNAVTMLSADCVVIGGGVSQLGDWLLNPVRATLRERCRTVALDRVKVVLSALGQDAGVIGAALWASQKFG